MLRFPRLKSGVSVQHPFQRTVECPIRVFTFLDGKEQRFPVRRRQKRWTVHLDQLDEQELAEVEAFARAHLLTLEPFEFADPGTGTVHGPCRLDRTSFELHGSGPRRLGTTLVVVEEGE